MEGFSLCPHGWAILRRESSSKWTILSPGPLAVCLPKLPVWVTHPHPLLLSLLSLWGWPSGEWEAGELGSCSTCHWPPRDLSAVGLHFPIWQMGLYIYGQPNPCQALSRHGFSATNFILHTPPPALMGLVPSLLSYIKTSYEGNLCRKPFIPEYELQSFVRISFTLSRTLWGSRAHKSDSNWLKQKKDIGKSMSIAASCRVEESVFPHF